MFVGGQVNKETITFDYSIPTVTKVTPYCGQGVSCMAPVDAFDTDGCSASLYWEEYGAWQARSKGVAGGKAPRMCGTGGANDKWQMAVIEGTSLGSSALAATGAPLRISVKSATSVDGQDADVFYLVTGTGTTDGAGGKCPECEHTHTRIIAMSAPGYGRHLNLTVALGDSISNGFPWSYKAPQVTRVEAFDGSNLRTDGKASLIVRGANLGSSPTVLYTPPTPSDGSTAAAGATAGTTTAGTAAAGTAAGGTVVRRSSGNVNVRVFFGYEYDVGGVAIGFTGVDVSTGLPLGGASMRECADLTPWTQDETDAAQAVLGPAQWYRSYDFSSSELPVNVDGLPYVEEGRRSDVLAMC